MDTTIIYNQLRHNSKNLGEEFKRLFHGRGGLWEEWRFLTIDSIDAILLVQFFFDIGETIEKKVIDLLLSYMQTSRHETLMLKRRYVKGSLNEVIVGELPPNPIAIENGLKFKLNLSENQNIGYFGDMKNGRDFIRNISKGKRVLNLFSYTCGFSLAAKKGGAASVVNVDMSKRVLATGMANHRLNGIDPKGVSFLPYNILRSFAKIKRKGPFDVIIIDPPTFQRGSFEATKDYRTILSKLPELADEECTLLACLNSPDLDESFLIEQINTLAPEFVFRKRLPNPEEYKSLDEKRSLKNLVFTREVQV